MSEATTTKSTKSNLKIMAINTDVEILPLAEVGYTIEELNTFTSSYLIFFTVDEGTYLFNEFCNNRYQAQPPIYESRTKLVSAQGIYTVAGSGYPENSFVVTCQNSDPDNTHTIHLKVFIFTEKFE